ncbi:hypothetical protein LTR09_012831 [Extremus antarcticus]|uniref:Uncharacterized protein n=1 Tax=Extremus antarcticus TaxID=702011 RepID=A0AAJ0G6R3_9PEZI|nr:hypothetical protein LTR09_012831 [Extremus antarcticus]
MVSSTAKNLINFVGKVKPSQITSSTWKSSVQKFCENFETQNAETDVKNAEIRGAKPHKSNDDPSETNDVISVRFTDSNGKRVASAHVYENGNGKVVRW